MVSDSFNENEHFLNTYEYHKSSYLLYNHFLQYRLHLSEITNADTKNTKNNGLILITDPIISALLIHVIIIINCVFIIIYPSILFNIDEVQVE